MIFGYGPYYRVLFRNTLEKRGYVRSRKNNRQTLMSSIKDWPPRVGVPKRENGKSMPMMKRQMKMEKGLENRAQRWPGD
jgi:hypothetical protein